MKLKHLLLALTTFVPFLLLAQYGTVKNSFKISATSGGFTGLNGDIKLFGSTSITVGDLNLDGIIDIAVKTYDQTNFRGLINILFLSSNGSVKSSVRFGEGEGITGILFSDDFGYSIANMGDLDNDGNSDIVVGDIRAGASNSQTGAITFFYLNADGTVKSYKQINRDVITTLPNNGYFGTSVANVGDINKDGYTDIAVSSSNELLNGRLGCVYILFLDSGQNIKSFRKIGANSGGLNGDFSEISRMGDGLGSIGDFNKDGVNDIAFRVNNKIDSFHSRGGIILAMLNPNGTVKNYSRIGHYTLGLEDLIEYDFFGQTIVKLQDLDGDGVDEIAVGAPFDTTYNVGRGGSVRILFMNADGNVKSVQKIDNLSGNFNQPIADGDDFGRIGMLGDFNNDSIPDLLVGSASKDEGGTNKGALYLLMLNGVPSVGLNDVHAKRIQVNLYPNPAKYQVQVSCPYPVTQITITDVTGKVIHQQKNNEPIQVQTWQAGMYYLQVNTTQGTAVQKLVKR